LTRINQGAERGYIFWRIGERPILQKPHGLVIELPEPLWTFDLVASHHQIKKFHLCDLSDPAVKTIYFLLPLIKVALLEDAFQWSREDFVTQVARKDEIW
jgi:hypothetical protein